MQERLTRQLGRLVLGREFLEELRERKCLLRQTDGLLVLREYFSELVTENRCATRFKSDYRRARFNFAAQRSKNLC